MNVEDLLPDPKHRVLLDWLTTVPSERSPSTKCALAEQLGVTDRTLQRWQRSEVFRRAWEKTANDVVGSPENKQEVIEMMRRLALDEENGKQVQAAKLYLDAVDAIKPPQVDVTVSRKDLAEFTDDELMEKIAERMASLPHDGETIIYRESSNVDGVLYE